MLPELTGSALFRISYDHIHHGFQSKPMCSHDLLQLPELYD